MKSDRVMFRVFVQIFVSFLLLTNVHSQIFRNKLKKTKQKQKLAPSAIELRRVGNNQVVVDNGIFQVTFSNPQGLITGIKYKGIDVLDENIEERGYWDIFWNGPNEQPKIDMMEGTKFNIITQNEKQIEISFSKTWNISQRGISVPLNIDKRYIIRTGVSGIYMYNVLERLQGWPDVSMEQIRMAFKLNPNKFDFMAISDDIQRKMPSMEDRNTENGRAKPLEYKEAVLLTNPQNPSIKGQVDDKYMYSMENKDSKVHGWISLDPRVGFWLITPSTEFLVGGPIRQELTSHAGPITLSMFTSVHYAGEDMNTNYNMNEAWKKVLGPVFVYLNSASSSTLLWSDAKRQMAAEVQSWPYDFVKSADYPLRRQRGSVKGQLFIMDRFKSESKLSGEFAYVGLATPGQAGSWQTESKGYQFWGQADKMGMFTINNVRPGNYSLYAWCNGVIGDYKYEQTITVKPGVEVNVGAIVYEPPRNGPTLWEIGVPDRTAAEFYIPLPEPTLTTNLYVDPNLRQEKFRQYGLWTRYTNSYPQNDVVYTVGMSDYKKDWFYAHVSRKVGNNLYRPTTWQIVFNLKEVIQTGVYTLRIALASSTYSNLHVRINGANSKPIFMTGFIGKDNAIARHGIHGLYKLFNVDILGSLLKVGDNTIYLTQAHYKSQFAGIMYDYIRLEAPRET